MIILTDFGHDPDDLIAISLLIEHGYIPEAIILSPGFSEQVSILSGFIKSYKISPEIFICQNKVSDNYNSGKHRKFLSSPLPYSPIENSHFTSDALIIGPARNLGGKLECQKMFFQGGYSPNSIRPLEKFKGMNSVQSFNPSGAKTDFNSLLESQNISEKRYIGKNVCHGYSKKDMKWKPSNKLVLEFFDQLNPTKKMHDVLAAQLFMSDFGIWERAKPVWEDMKLTTVPTNEETYSLIGIE